MPPRTITRTRQAVTAVIFGGVVVAVSLWAGQYVPSRATSGESPGATQTAVTPLSDAEAAIQQSTALFPRGKTPYGQVARLTTRLAFEVWANNGIPGDRATPDPDEFDWAGADPMAPVWLVGLLGQGLTVADVLREGAPPGVVLTDLRPVPGAFYAWDANGAELIAQGALMASSGQTYDSVVALANAPLTPVAATAWPTAALATPLPMPTWSPAELATAIAHLTAVPRIAP